MRTSALLAALAAIGLLLPACGGGDEAPAPDAGVSATTFTVKVENVATGWRYLKSGSFTTPDGADAPGPIGPGGSYTTTFTAGVGARLSFAVMFGESNDWFFAPAPEGIALYDADGQPVSGDVTAQIHLYNAGTEIDQEPGVGPDTGPHQGTQIQGPADPDPTVREVTRPATLGDGTSFPLPAVGSMIAVSLASEPASRSFTLTVRNVSDAQTLGHTDGSTSGIHLSPGVYVVGTAAEALFTLGQPDRGEGLKDLAEAGKVANLEASAAAASGVATPFSPLIYVVSSSGHPLFTRGAADVGAGLEQLAESGNVAPLAGALGQALPAGASAFGKVTVPDGAAQDGAIKPGASFTFQVQARPGDALSIASMFGASDDWFAGFADTGLPLFDAAGQPVTGDVSGQLVLWNAGTELDEEPAVGADTGPQQASPDQGAPDAVDQVRPVEATLYAVPLTQHLRVTLTAP
jgi:hypothetical protein